MKHKGLLVICCCLIFSLVHGQSDNARLTYTDFLTNILKYHPAAKQANLKVDLAAAVWLSAKGNLDPTLSSTWNQKSFDDKLYYRQFEGKFKIPTRLGIAVVGGYENTDGEFLNQEATTDRYGLWNAGVEVDLLQGLVVNERNTALKQAEIFQDLAERQRQMGLNDLLYSASLAYLNWQQYFSFRDIILENQQLAQVYLDNTKTSFVNGDKTAMDTLEATIILQEARTLFQSNQAALEKARQELENFLWFDDVPVALQPTTIPQQYLDTLFIIPQFASLPQAVNDNPKFAEKLGKQEILEAEQRLKREKLKPKLKVKYNPLLATADDSLLPSYSLANYKWGFDFTMPLFLRTARADIQMGDIKLQENKLDIEYLQNELQNKIENSLQQQTILQQQLVLYQQNVEGFRLLLEGENEKFSFGESSVFLVNKRQEKYINGQLKLVGVNTKLQKEILDYLYLTNSLIDI